MKVCPRCQARSARESWTCERCGASPQVIDGFPAFAPQLAKQNAGFRAESFARLVEVEERNFWFRARGELVKHAARRNGTAPHSILEIGCGNGAVLEQLAAAFPEARLTGTDVYTVGLPQAAKRVPCAEFLQMDAQALPFDEEFDLILACDVIEHIDRDDVALAEIRRSLRPKGRVVITVPQHPQLWAPSDDYACHKRRYRRPELVERVKAAGLNIIRCHSFTSLLCPLQWWSRRRQRRARTYDPMRELNINSALNAALGSVMTLERQLLRAGFDFPFGGSLLLLAERSS